jgi:hypothetical protein
MGLALPLESIPVQNHNSNWIDFLKTQFELNLNWFKLPETQFESIRMEFESIRMKSRKILKILRTETVPIPFVYRNEEVAHLAVEIETKNIPTLQKFCQIWHEFTQIFVNIHNEYSWIWKWIFR